MPSRISGQRFQRNIESLRDLVNSGSQSIVRDAMVGRAISGFKLRHPIPSIGHRSGKLTVTGYLKGPRGGVASIIVRCDCGQDEYTVDKHNFKDFKSTRCPTCARFAGSQKRFWKYSAAMPNDEHRTRLLHRLAAAIRRCHSPNDKSYKSYGGRGIHVHQQWREDRASFLLYVQTLVGWDKPELEMDRTNVNRGYEPGNLRFISRRENINNKRKVYDLEEEIARLRSLLRGAEEPIHNPD